MFGSFFDIDKELRHCNYCLKSNIYSVEFHMLLLYPLYSNLRTEFYYSDGYVDYVNKKTIMKYFVYLNLYITRFY